MPIERYTSRAFHELEVEKVWKKVWQMACREEDIPEVGDHLVYDDRRPLDPGRARRAPDEIQAFQNACLHRGRQPARGRAAPTELRCPFHGWTWNLDGSLKTIPCEWDFPHVDRGAAACPRSQVGTWGGFVFINLDPSASRSRTSSATLPRTSSAGRSRSATSRPTSRRCSPANWKVAQEAFMEAYHVVATHPQLLAGIGDANSQYDVFGNFSRAITPNGTPSPHLDWQPTEQDMLDSMFDPRLDDRTRACACRRA